MLILLKNVEFEDGIWSNLLEKCKKNSMILGLY